MKVQKTFIFTSEPQPNFAKQSSARGAHDKEKNAFFICHAEPQPNFDYSCRDVLSNHSLEEIGKKTSIRKPLKYIAVRGSSHYDGFEALTKELMRKHLDGITQKMILGLFFNGMR